MAEISSSVHTLALERSTALLSVGIRPETKTDMLALGSVEAADFKSLLAADYAAIGIESQVVDDAVIVKETDGRVGIAYDHETTFRHRIKSLAGGAMVDALVKPWTLTPWLPEAFAADLSGAVVLKDEIGIADDVEKFRTYPDALQTSLIERARQEIRLKEALQNDDGLRPLEMMYGHADISLAGIRIVHASQKVYFRGVRYLSKTLPLLDRSGVQAVEQLCQAAPLTHEQRQYLGV